MARANGEVNFTRKTVLLYKQNRSTLQVKLFYFTRKTHHLAGRAQVQHAGYYGLDSPRPARRNPLQRYGIVANPIAVAPAAQRIRGTTYR
jgi:hypothetical protein